MQTHASCPSPRRPKTIALVLLTLSTVVSTNLVFMSNITQCPVSYGLWGVFYTKTLKASISIRFFLIGMNIKIPLRQFYCLFFTFYILIYCCPDYSDNLFVIFLALDSPNDICTLSCKKQIFYHVSRFLSWVNSVLFSSFRSYCYPPCSHIPLTQTGN